MVEEIQKGKSSDFKVNENVVHWFQDQLCVLDVENIRKLILEEAYDFAYLVHLRTTKMYQYLKHIYWWNDMKKDMENFMSKCLVCKQVKAKHSRLANLH